MAQRTPSGPSVTGDDVAADAIDDAGRPRRGVQRRPAFEEQRRARRSRAGRRSPAPDASSSRARIVTPRPRRACARSGCGAVAARVVTTQDRARDRGCRRGAPSGGMRSRRSNTTRISGRARHTSRAVSTGSSASSVPDPMPMAATSARTRCACRCDAAPLIVVRAPGAAATALSRLIAILATTNGRRGHDVGHEHLVQAPRLGLADADRRPRRRDRAGRRSRGRRPRGYGSCIAATTRRMPASATATAHGPVRPVWLHGSSVQ